MTIGILTYHRAHNYGACLQAVAMRLILEELGHKVYYIDYWPDYHANSYKLFSLTNLNGKNWNGRVMYLLNSFKGIKQKKERINSFNLFLQQFIIPYCKPMTDHFDAIIYGSDQIWRKQSALKAYNPIYFAEKRNLSKKHIAFAASMGILPTNEIDRQNVKKLVSNFNHIAVREDNLKFFLDSIGFKDVKTVLDPTLLLSKEKWDSIINIYSRPVEYKPYVLVYYVSELAFDMSQIRYFAKSRGLEIKILCGSANNSKEKGMLSTADPIAFLSLFKNATYTFVTSFHGLAFSILFEREFYTSFINNSNRAKTLLKITGLETRLLVPKSEIADQKKIDYSIVKSKLSLAKEESINTLLLFLSN